MTNSNTSTSFTYNLYCALEAHGIDPDSIDESAISIDESAMIDPAFEEEDIF